MFNGIEDKLITSGVDDLRGSPTFVCVGWEMGSRGSPGPVLKK